MIKQFLDKYSHNGIIEVICDEAKLIKYNAGIENNPGIIVCEYFKIMIGNANVGRIAQAQWHCLINGKNCLAEIPIMKKIKKCENC